MRNSKLLEKVRARSGSASDEKSEHSQSSGEKGTGTNHPSALAGKVLSNPASAQRSRMIALVDIGELLPISLQRVARRLNSLQTGLFRFDVVTPAVKKLGVPDRLHGYSNGLLFNSIGTRIKESDYDFVIGVTHHRLDEDRFNRHSEKEGLGVVTVADASEYMPRGKTLEQYLCYLILCEAFCLVGREHFEHDDVSYCLFDMCHVKRDLLICLARPHICTRCEQRLRNAGFSQQDIERGKQVLAYVGKTRLWDVCKEIVAHPIIGLLGGGLVIGILSEIFANFPTRWALGILGFLLFCFLVFMGIRYRQAQPRP